MPQHNIQTKLLEDLLKSKALTPLDIKKIKSKYVAIADLRKKAERCSSEIDKILDMARRRRLNSPNKKESPLDKGDLGDSEPKSNIILLNRN